MNIYAIVGHQGIEKLGPEIKRVYPTDHYFLSPATWFVADSLTSTEVSKKLGIANGKIGAQAVVVAMSGYNGYAPNDLWEWIKTRLQATVSG